VVILGWHEVPWNFAEDNMGFYRISL